MGELVCSDDDCDNRVEIVDVHTTVDLEEDHVAIKCHCGDYMWPELDPENLDQLKTYYLSILRRIEEGLDPDGSVPPLAEVQET